MFEKKLFSGNVCLVCITVLVDGQQCEQALACLEKRKVFVFGVKGWCNVLVN